MGLRHSSREGSVTRAMGLERRNGQAGLEDVHIAKWWGTQLSDDLGGVLDGYDSVSENRKTLWKFKTPTNELEEKICNNNTLPGADTESMEFMGKSFKHHFNNKIF